MIMGIAGDLVRRAGRARLGRKKGLITTLYTAPPPHSVVVCLDEVGPESAKSLPRQELVPVEAPAALAQQERPTPPTAGNGTASSIGRAIQESNYGRRARVMSFGPSSPPTAKR
jgi:hypothetical protein